MVCSMLRAKVCPRNIESYAGTTNWWTDRELQMVIKFVTKFPPFRAHKIMIILTAENEKLPVDKFSITLENARRSLEPRLAIFLQALRH